MTRQAEARWRLVPALLLRRAGFPFTLLDELADGDAARVASDLAQARSCLEDVRESLLRRVVPAEVDRLAAAGERAALRALSKWRGRLGRRRVLALPPGPWSAAVLDAQHRLLEAHALVEDRAAELRAVLAAEHDRAGARLHALLDQPGVRLALFLLSPDFAESARRRAAARQGTDGDQACAASTASTASERAFTRRLLLYTQRLCAKNETTSFFGPVTHGCVDAAQRGLRFGTRTETGVRERRGFMAFWAVHALARAVAREPALRRELPVRPLATTRRDGERVTGPTGRTVRLSAEQGAVFDAVDGRRGIAGIATVTGIEEPVVDRVVTRAEAAGLLALVPEPLSTVPQPLDDLAAQLETLPSAGAWVATLGRLRGEVAAFTRTDDPEVRAGRLQRVEQRFVAVTGEPPRRAAGEMYADRTVVFEDCCGDRSPFAVGGELARRWEHELALVLDLAATLGRLRHRAVRTLAGTVVDELGGCAPYLDFVEALRARVASGALEGLAVDERAWCEAYAERVSARTEDGQARLGRRDVEDLLDPGTTDDDPGTAPWGPARFCSPDVLVDTSVDPHRLVLGEVHPYVYAWGSQGLFGGEGLQRTFEAVLPVWGGRRRLATVLRRRRHKGLVAEWFPGRFVEVSGRGSREPGRSLPIADLRVRSGAAGAELLDGTGQPLCLYTGEEDHPHLAAFAPPPVVLPVARWPDGGPRVTVGEVVAQRAEWQVTGEPAQRLSCGDPVERAVAIAELRRDRGVPRWTYLHAPAEPKPICVDLDNPLFHDIVGRFARDGLCLREMLPAPGGLLPLGDDAAYTSEFRLGMWRR